MGLDKSSIYMVNMVECGTRSEDVKKVYIGLVCVLALAAVALGIHIIKKTIPEHSFELQDVKVSWSNDSDEVGTIQVTDDDDRWVSVVPTILTYELTFKPLDNLKYYQFDEGVLSASIEPSEELVNQSKLKLGHNMYKGMGIYQSHVKVLSPKETKVTIDYIIGADKRNKTFPLAPSTRTLNDLKQLARDGSVELVRNSQTIGRFSLQSKKREDGGLFN